MVMLLSMFGSAQPALLSFPSERPVFLREYSTNHYSVISYFISRFTMEALLTGLQILLQCVICYFMVGFSANFGIFYASIYTLAMASTALAVLLGSAVEDPKLAIEMLPILFVPQMLFAGFFVATDLIPIWLRWAQYLCSLTYGLRILLVEEFWDCGGSDESLNQSCNNLVTGVGANPDNTWWYWIVLAAIFVVFRLTALVVLRKKATKFF
jgi:ABC-type multidrug transport system permease subunit